LLEEQVAELKIVDRCSNKTIGRTQKNILKPRLQKQWVIPPDANAAFLAGIKDVLGVYQRSHDPEFPLVCLDESSKQFVAEARTPILGKSGHPRRQTSYTADYEYERDGTANLFMMFAPLEGWRHVKYTDRRAAMDFPQAHEDLSDTHFSAGEKIILVQAISTLTSRRHSTKPLLPLRRADWLSSTRRSTAPCW
jgi:hypothetical protein